MSEELVRGAYGFWADEYVARFGEVGLAAPQDRQVIEAWGGTLDGPVLDVGAGPGHWTAFLRERGLDVDGVDLTPEFVDSARRRFPGVTFRVGSMVELGVPEGALGGILCWYSIIHLPPEQVPGILAGFARALRAGGSLLIGFVEGPNLEPFDHKVVEAHYWPVPAMEAALTGAGFEVLETHTRTDEGSRPQAAMVAKRKKRPAATAERFR